MFKVGKKYRFIGEDPFYFNSDKKMDFLLTGEHVVKSVLPFNPSYYMRVSFVDDPGNFHWALKVEDFEEVEE